MLNHKYLVGIDEVGRGPLAGPVGVGVVLVPKDFDFGMFRGLRDSKKMSPKHREVILKQTKQLKKEKKLDFAVTLVNAGTIDKIGIVSAINKGLRASLRKVLNNKIELNHDFIKVYLDGNLRAPTSFKNQQTIIKGDDLIPAISLASVVAKVTRDLYMKKLSKLSSFDKYQFEKHKGYGTKQHLQCILRYGLSAEHRQSFCRRFVGL
jgi:ribonuclease HII